MLYPGGSGAMLPWGDKGGGCGRRGAGTQFIRAAWRTHGCIFGRFWASGGKLKIYRKCVRRRSPPESCRNGSLAALGPAQGTFSTILYRFWGEKGGKITSRFRFLRNPQFCIFFARVPSENKILPGPMGLISHYVRPLFASISELLNKLFLFGLWAAPGH